MKKHIYIAFFLLLGLSTLSAQHSISGKISCINGFPMGGQEVELNGSQISNMIVTTDGNGDYSFPNLPAGGDYSLSIQKTDNPLNGVSTYDMVLIAKHILGIDLLPSPYGMLIADINDNGAITTLDLVVLRKVILAISAGFPNGLSWRFASEDYNDSPPMGSVDGAEFTNLSSDEVTNFVAVKIGDVNGSAVCQ